jgi:hypothetical protein
MSVMKTITDDGRGGGLTRLFHFAVLCQEVEPRVTYFYVSGADLYNRLLANCATCESHTDCSDKSRASVLSIPKFLLRPYNADERGDKTTCED